MDENFLLGLGKRIAEIRQSHKMTQAALAEILNVSPKHISHTECGTSSLSLKNLVVFCQLFNCSLDFLIFGKEDTDVLKKLPDEITDLLYTGTSEDIEHFNRFLSFYVDFLNAKKNK